MPNPDLVADFGTRAFWLGAVCALGYVLVIVALGVAWWLSREARPTERLTKAEREFLEAVGRARR